MKKMLVKSVVASLILSSMPSILIGAPIKLKINNTYITPIVEPVEKNGTTLVPLRVVSENLGADVNWDDSTKSITITKGKTEIKLCIGNKTVSVNGKSKQLILPPQSVRQTTMVPIRFVSENLDCKVEWENGIVNITNSDETSLNEDDINFLDVKSIQKELELLLAINATKEELDMSVGIKPTKVINAKDNNKSCWRYELNKQDGYKYEGEASKYDSLDTQAMKDGSLDAVLFSEFNDNNILIHYTLYYVEDSNRIIEIRDGEQSIILTNLN